MLFLPFPFPISIIKKKYPIKSYSEILGQPHLVQLHSAVFTCMFHTFHNGASFKGGRNLPAMENSAVTLFSLNIMRKARQGRGADRAYPSQGRPDTWFQAVLLQSELPWCSLVWQVRKQPQNKRAYYRCRFPYDLWSRLSNFSQSVSLLYYQDISASSCWKIGLIFFPLKEATSAAWGFVIFFLQKSYSFECTRYAKFNTTWWYLGNSFTETIS